MPVGTETITHTDNIRYVPSNRGYSGESQLCLFCTLSNVLGNHTPHQYPWLRCTEHSTPSTTRVNIDIKPIELSEEATNCVLYYSGHGWGLGIEHFNMHRTRLGSRFCGGMTILKVKYQEVLKRQHMLNMVAVALLNTAIYTEHGWGRGIKTRNKIGRVMDP